MRHPKTNLLLLCLALLLPFAGRPLHVDDPVFVWAGQHIVHHPGDFYGFSVNWGRRDFPAAVIFLSPPLTSYYLAAASTLVGWQELNLHLAYLPFSIFGVIGFFILAGQYCKRPGLCTVLLMLCPAFWISSTTLMCEPSLLCYWIWAIVFWLWGQKKSPWFLPLCGLCISAAIITKLTALAIIPLLLLHAILHRNRWSLRLIQGVSLLIPVVVTIIYNTIFAHLYGSGAFQHAADYAAKTQNALNIPTALRIIDTLIFVGGGAAIACLTIPTMIWRPRTSIICLILLIGTAAVVAASASPPPAWDSGSAPALTLRSFSFYLQFMLMLGLGLAAAIQCCRQLAIAFKLRNWRDEAFLLSWIAAIFIFAGFLNWSINARSILPLIPPLCILLVRRLDQTASLPRLRTAIVLAIGGTLSLAITLADYRLPVTVKLATEIIPRQVAKLPVSDKAHPPRLWFVGHWGFQYYMQAAGCTIVDGSNPAWHVGDYVLIPDSAYGGILRATGFNFVENFTIGERRWASTANTSLGAGFYHSDGYALPFIIGTVPAETFTLVQVTPQSRILP